MIGFRMRERKTKYIPANKDIAQDKSGEKHNHCDEHY